MGYAYEALYIGVKLAPHIALEQFIAACDIQEQPIVEAWSADVAGVEFVRATLSIGVFEAREILHSIVTLEEFGFETFTKISFEGFYPDAVDYEITRQAIEDFMLRGVARYLTLYAYDVGLAFNFEEEKVLSRVAGSLRLSNQYRRWTDERLQFIQLPYTRE